MKPRLGVAACLAALLAPAQIAQAQTHDFTLTRIMHAPPEAVWQALTDAEAVREWWGPEGFSSPYVNADLTLGGTTVVCKQPRGGLPKCNGWVYTEIEPVSRLVFDQIWVDQDGRTIDPATDGLPPGLPAVVPNEVELMRVEDGTELVWREFGYPDEALAKLSQSRLEQVLDKLERAVE
jgi:uncharacterized protein YndB with AHSA1/START domain